MWLSSLYIIFVHNYRRKKQTFVKVIWLFTSAVEICLAVIYYYLIPLIESETLPWEEYQKLDVAIKTIAFVA